MKLHPAGIQVHHVLKFPPAILAQVHDIPHILLGGNDADLGVGLLRQLNLHGIREVQGGEDQHGFPGGLGHPVDHVGGGGDQVQVIFPLQSLLDDLHVQQSQEAAPETKA